MGFKLLLTASEVVADGSMTGAQPGIGDMLVTFLPMIGIVVVLYFVMLRPQRKKDKALKEQVSKMAVGDKAVTIGGITGTVANIKDDEVTISTSVAHTMVTFKKSSISSIQKRESD